MMHQLSRCRVYRHIRNILIAVFITTTITVLNDFSYQQAGAVTPTNGVGKSKPKDFVIWLPWRESDVPGPVGFGYKYGQCNEQLNMLHCNEDYYALDFMLPENTPVYPVAKGKVKTLEKNVEGYGNVVMIEHDGPDAAYQSLYAHLKEIPTSLNLGQSVDLNTKIGSVGMSGQTIVHLHFALRQGSAGLYDGTPVVPEPFVGKDVYEGFGVPWQWSVIGRTLPNPLVTTIPGGMWGSGATKNYATIQPGQAVNFQVTNFQVNTKEVRLTVGYSNWSILSDTWNKEVWRILARCRKGENVKGCRWSGDSTLDFSWVPGSEDDSQDRLPQDRLLCPVPWLPCNNSSAPNDWSQIHKVQPDKDKDKAPKVCISFDVFDTSGNANYAPNGVNCASLLGLANTNSNVAYAADDNAGRLIYIVPDTTPPNPNAWLLEFSKAQHPPLDYDIHIRVQWTSDFDAFRICFDGTLSLQFLDHAAKRTCNWTGVQPLWNSLCNH